MGVVAAVSSEAALAFIEIGAVIFGLAVLARVAGHLGITAIPFYLLAGLLVGEGGVAPLDVSADFISTAAQIGVLLLLFALGLEYSTAELRRGLRRGVPAGVADAVANFAPGALLGLAMGWEAPAVVVLGGVTWISSSGVVAKVLSDLGRLGNRETPTVLNILVIEDLAMAAYLPIVGALVAGEQAFSTAVTVVVALGSVVLVLAAAMRWGDRLSDFLAGGTDESLMLSVFGLTLLVGGLAEQLSVSSAIGAFIVGMALSGHAQERARELIEPLRDLFAATFFLFFSFQIDAADLISMIGWATGLAVVTAVTKVASTAVAAARDGVSRRGQLRAGTALIARGEFSIVIAALGADLADATELQALAAGYVLISATLGPLATRAVDGARDKATPTTPAPPTPPPRPIGY